MVIEKIAVVQAKSEVATETKEEGAELEIPETRAPKVLRRGRRQGQSSGLSLKNIGKKADVVTIIPEDEIDKDTLPKTPFSENQFISKWKEYAMGLAKRGDKSLSSILMANKPKLEIFTIHHTLPNQLMADQLEKNRPRLLKFLRESLNNFSIELNVVIEVTEVKKFIYTPQEKYAKLAEINPSINTLRSKFGLDL